MITNIIKPLYLVINKINGYIEESNGNKYLTLLPIDGKKQTIKKYEELLSKIRDLIRLKSHCLQIKVCILKVI